MKQRTLRKILCTVMVTLLGLCMAGCNKAGQAKKVMGRYVEKEMELPSEDGSFLILPEDLCEKKYGGEFQLTDGYESRYIRQDDGSWDREEVPWYSREIDQKARGTKLDILGDDEVEYAVVRYMKEDALYEGIAKLYRCTENGAEEIEIKDMQERTTLPEGLGEGYLIPRYLHVFADQSILIGYDQSTVLYDKKGIRQYELNDTFGRSTVVNGDTLAVINGKTQMVESYEVRTGKKTTEVPLGALMTQSTSAFDNCGVLFYGKDELLYLQNRNGIHRLSKGGSVWTTILDGSLYSIYSDEFFAKQIIENEDQSFFIIGSDEFGFHSHLYQYTYDETIPANPEVTLNIYAMYGSPVVRQCIINYQNKHPEVRVDYQVAINSQNSDSDPADCIKVLNTLLLSGNGADIIFMDYLDANSYIRNGILADLSSILNPMVASGQLAEPIAKAYEKDGKIYAVPTRLSFPVIAGVDETIQKASTLSELATLAETSSISLFSGTTVSSLTNDLYQYYKKDLYDLNHQLDETKLEQFMEDLNTIIKHSDLLNDSDYGDVGDSSIYQLKDKVCELGIGMISIFQDVQEKLLLTHITGCKLSTINQQYVPLEAVSINQASKQKEYAEQFITDLLSDDIQQHESGSGLPVNLHQIQPERLTEDIHGSGGVAMYPYLNGNGGKDEVEILFPSKEDAKIYRALYNDLKTPCPINYTVDAKLGEALNSYVTGAKTLEEAVGTVKDFLTIQRQE